MISRHNQPWQPTERPIVDWSDTGVPRSVEYDDVYYSSANGVAESRYVFLQGSQLDQHARHPPEEDACVVETGFGTGLNFLVTADHWLSEKQANSSSRRTSRLHYVGIDAKPLSASDVTRASAHWPDFKFPAKTLISEWPGSVRGCHRLQWHHLGITLDLWWEDALAVLGDLSSHGRQWVNYWYLDGFAPAKNADLWCQTVFQHMGELSKPGARFTTFTAAGHVRRGLSEAGFEVKKREGFGQKRECLEGVFKTPPASAYSQLEPSAEKSPTIRMKPSPICPWDVADPSPNPGKAIVIGAGLAGAFAARALADRGIQVVVLDGKQVASGGSSNLQGITYTRPSRRFSPLTDFAIASYLNATSLYKRLLDSGEGMVGLQEGIDGSQCGYLQLSSDHETLDYLSQFADPALPFRILSPGSASELLGIACDQRAIWFPDACWLNPAAVCLERLQHPNIELLVEHPVVSITRRESGWQVQCIKRELKADTVILASAYDIAAHTFTDWLPLQAIRGQTTHLPTSVLSHTPTVAVCHEGYLPPPRDGVHCIGASYGPNDASCDERRAEHEENLERLKDALPALSISCDAQTLRGHVALRCTTADYLPVVGPVPDKDAFNLHYDQLRHRKTAVIEGRAPLIPDLWMIGGLGSRGLTAAPLAGEILASDICGESPPISRQLHRALSPARFLARGLIRGAPL